MARTYKSYKAPGTRPPNISLSVRHCAVRALMETSGGYISGH